MFVQHFYIQTLRVQYIDFQNTKTWDEVEIRVNANIEVQHCHQFYIYLLQFPNGAMVVKFVVLKWNLLTWIEKKLGSLQCIWCF